jgi:hypothetical protein
LGLGGPRSVRAWTASEKEPAGRRRYEKRSAHQPASESVGAISMLFLCGFYVLAALVKDQAGYFALVVLDEVYFGIHDLEEKLRLGLRE